MSLKTFGKSLLGNPLLIIGVAMIAYIGVLKVSNARLAKALHEETVRANNEAARADTTRDVAQRALSWLQQTYGDSIKAVERLVVQEKIKKDGLDAALKRESILKADLRIALDSLLTSLYGSPTTEDSAGNRSSVFDTTAAPFTVHARVTLPKPPAPGIMDTLKITVQPLNLRIRAQCGPVVNRARAATLLVEQPKWVVVRLDSLKQDPDVCSVPPPARTLRNIGIGGVLGLALGFLLFK